MKLTFSATFHKPQGDTWEICAMQEGEIEGRGQYISGDALKASVPAFHNVWVQNLIWQDGFQDHLPDSARHVFPDGVVFGNIVGVVASARAETLENGKVGIVATFRASDQTIKDVLMQADEAGMLHKVGLSINGSAREDHVSERTLDDGYTVLDIRQIDQIDSIDLVTKPGAGGYFRALLASASTTTPALTQGGTTIMRNTLKQLLDAKGIPYRDGTALGILASIGIHAAKGEEPPIAELSPEDQRLFDAIYEALSNGMNDLAESVMKMVLKSHPKAAAEGDPEAKPVKASAFDRKMRQLDIRLSQLQASELINADPALPAPVKTLLASKFAGRVVNEADIRAEIDMQKQILASAGDSGQVRNFGTDVDLGLESTDKTQIALHKLFNVKASDGERSSWQGVSPFRSLKQAYHAYTGDGERVSGRLVRASSFTTGSFSDALGNTMHRRLINLYQAKDMPWRKLVTIRPGAITDFRTQYIVQVGGLEDLSIVNEDGEYGEITVNSSDDANYNVSSRGKILTVTRRVIKNDDIGFIERLLQKANRAAHRTLQKFVFDLLLNATSGINTGTIYDGKALYHDDHANLMDLPFSYDNVLAMGDLLSAQCEADSNEPLDLEPTFLIIPKELKKQALVFVKSEGKPGTANNDANIFPVDEENLIVVDKVYLDGDANNFYMCVDPKIYETIELGFMDGQEEPEVLLQDAPSAGMVFTHDRIRYKVRHEYGGCVVDYRGLAASIVE